MSVNAAKVSSSSPSAPAFNLLVQLTFVDEAAAGMFVSSFAPLAKYVAENESNTLMYQLMKSDKNPLLYNIIERYADKDRDYLGTHKSSEEFQSFRAILGDMQTLSKVTISGESYLDVEI
ncbi:hypothetical protein TrVE_jg2276 [Triparma verrucosa]|uniref:ABM domain-containing protein n=1 Tax=Triparma verrucosa TaxID=1606542 RepID=A0A9W7FEE4_9STRA|nr:hypothetical protein TrVE_jg2276 [Triparma verrucosa]